MSEKPANRHKAWACPFFKWDGKVAIHGECGKPLFPTEKAADDYMTHYCAANPGWKYCSLASALCRYYEGEDER